MNILFPLFSDDWEYTFIWDRQRKTLERVTSIGDIIQSQYSHYMRWGGRSVVHTIDQLLLLMGTKIADFLNALIYIIFLLVIYKISNKGRGVNTFLFLLISILMWFVHPAFLGVILWITGSANYLWGTLIILLFIYPYYSYYRSDNREQNKNGIIKSFFFFLFGIIAGWTNENMGVALIFFLIALLILLKQERKKISGWAIVGIIGVIVGFLIMILAPGNYERLEVEYNDLNLTGLSKFEIIKYRFPDMLLIYKRRLGFLSLLYIALFFIYIKFIKDGDQKNKKKVFITSLLFFLSSYVAFFVMFGSPVFPPRATFGIITLLLISNFLLIAAMMRKNKIIKMVGLVVVPILLIIFSIDFKKKLEYVNYIKDFWEKRELYVEEQKRAGNKDVIFTDYFVPNKRFQMWDVTTDPKSWINLVYARYYGLNTVRRIEKEE